MSHTGGKHGDCVSCRWPRKIEARGLCQRCYLKARASMTMDDYPPVRTFDTGAGVPLAQRPEIVIEQALARTGTISGAMAATGESYERVQKVLHRLNELLAA